MVGLLVEQYVPVVYTLSDSWDSTALRRSASAPGMPFFSLRGAYRKNSNTVNGPCSRTLDFPLFVRSGIFFLFFWSRGGEVFGVFLTPF